MSWFLRHERQCAQSPARQMTLAERAIDNNGAAQPRLADNSKIREPLCLCLSVFNNACQRANDSLTA